MNWTSDTIPTVTSPAPDGQPTPRRGRPRRTEPQRAIRSAASTLFARRGFGNTSMRDIAGLAGVDPALIIRHFGSKEALFLQTMSVDHGLRGLVDGPLESLGRAMLVRLVEELDDPTRAMYAALARSVDRAEVRAYLRESTRRHIVEPLAARLTGEDRELRAWLVAAQVHGLLSAWWVIEEDPAHGPNASSAVLDVYARAVQALIDPPSSDGADLPRTGRIGSSGDGPTAG